VYNNNNYCGSSVVAAHKSSKLAVTLMAEMNMKDFESQSDYIERLKKRIEKEAELQKEAAYQKQFAKELRKAELKEKINKLKAQREAIRKKAKEQRPISGKSKSS
jgi:hypothetical protein